ncbi:helix-turn-helix transcriptional regulator [Stappia sp.]|uniref:PadR family transcriptional regulator n=1 Tax=Stappia sp. TaxID=1870903 RepID=UPI0025E093FF|nr:helix-turn-helix transcriptional regulator [Stappia sp.]
MDLSVRTLCLAILNFGDATGYEIRKLSTEGKFRYFIEASFGSIYPTLARLEAEGLVTVREEALPGKPARKIYSLTESGRAEFVKLLAAPPAPDTYRSPFLLVAMCAELVGPDVISAAIDHRISQVRSEIETLDGISQESECQPAAQFILDYGRHCMTQDIRFLEDNRSRIENIARSAESAREAAE